MKRYLLIILILIIGLYLIISLKGVATNETAKIAETFGQIEGITT